MHFCKATIALSGDIQQIVHRNEFDPVSWPELEVIRSLHGDDAVTGVEPFVRVEQSATEERERLILKYGVPIVTQCYPGRSTREIEMEAPLAQLKTGIVWKNPISMEEEVVGEPPPGYVAPTTPRGKGGQRKAGEQFKLSGEGVEKPY